MAFVYLDDKFPEHPKVDPLSDAAFRLHVAGICYCNRHLTDGIIPADRVPRLVPRFRRTHLDELIGRTLWIALDHAGAYEIHDYLEWNSSRQKVEERRVKKSQAGQKGAQSRWGT